MSCICVDPSCTCRRWKKGPYMAEPCGDNLGHSKYMKARGKCKECYNTALEYQQSLARADLASAHTVEQLSVAISRAESVGLGNDCDVIAARRVLVEKVSVASSELLPLEDGPKPPTGPPTDEGKAHAPPHPPPPPPPPPPTGGQRRKDRREDPSWGWTNELCRCCNQPMTTRGTLEIQLLSGDANVSMCCHRCLTEYNARRPPCHHDVECEFSSYV